jgi:hypothetical protein
MYKVGGSLGRTERDETFSVLSLNKGVFDLSELDIEELERRLELTKTLPGVECWGNGCPVDACGANVCGVD